MTQRFGIDTSILVRLLTGDPEPEFDFYSTTEDTLKSTSTAPKSKTNCFSASKVVVVAQ